MAPTALGLPAVEHVALEQWRGGSAAPDTRGASVSHNLAGKGRAGGMSEAATAAPLTLDNQGKTFGPYAARGIPAPLSLSGADLLAEAETMDFRTYRLGYERKRCGRRFAGPPDTPRRNTGRRQATFVSPVSPPHAHFPPVVTSRNRRPVRLWADCGLLNTRREPGAVGRRAHQKKRGWFFSG